LFRMNPRRRPRAGADLHRPPGHLPADRAGRRRRPPRRTSPQDVLSVSEDPRTRGVRN